MAVKLSPEVLENAVVSTKNAVDKGALQEAMVQAASIFNGSPDQNKQLEDLLGSYKELEQLHNRDLAPPLEQAMKIYAEMGDITDILKKLTVANEVGHSVDIAKTELGDRGRLV